MKIYLVAEVKLLKLGSFILPNWNPWSPPLWEINIPLYSAPRRPPSKECLTTIYLCVRKHQSFFNNSLRGKRHPFKYFYFTSYVCRLYLLQMLWQCCMFTINKKWWYLCTYITLHALCQLFSKLPLVSLHFNGSLDK